MEAEESEDCDDDEEDTSKILEQIVRKRTLSAQSIGENQPTITEKKEKMNEEPKMNGVEKGKGGNDIISLNHTMYIMLYRHIIFVVLDNLMKAEDRKTGTVSFFTYVRYCKAAGG